MVIAIALLHGVPVFLIGIISRSKTALTIAALVSAAIGFATGNPAYFGVDLAAVVVAYFAARMFIPAKKAKAPPPDA